METTTQLIKTDVLVIGGGTAGTMAGIKAKQANPEAEVLILEKANIRLDFPEKNNQEWFCHVNLKKNEAGEMVLFKRAVEPYIVDVDLGREVYDVAVR